MSWSTSPPHVKPPYGVKLLRLCFPQAINSRKLQRDSRFHYLCGYLFLCIFDRHDKPFGVMGADVEPRTPDRRHHLLTAPDAEALRCPWMGRKIVGDVLYAFPDPNVLIAANLREDLYATENSRGP